MKTYLSLLIVLIIGLAGGYLLAGNLASAESNDTELLENNMAMIERRGDPVVESPQDTTSLFARIIEPEMARTFIADYQTGDCKLTYLDSVSNDRIPINGWRIEREVIDALITNLRDSTRIDGIQCYLGYNTNTKNHTIIWAAVQNDSLVIDDAHPLFDFTKSCPRVCPENDIDFPTE